MNRLIRARRGVLALATVCILVGVGLLPSEARAYLSCAAVEADVPANNLGTTGEVDNLADQPAGVPLPTSGVFGPSNLPPPNALGVYKNLPWGGVRWRDPTRSCKYSRQQFDFWPPSGYSQLADGKSYPTIVYFHPNGTNNHFDEGSHLYRQVAEKAHGLGYIFISVEFRHPVSDEYLADADPDNKVPHQDAGLFLQFLQQETAEGQIKVDTRNIFAFGHSRGTLALWQTLQPDAPGQTYTHQVSGFVGFQAQTSYGCEVFSNRYLIQDSAATNLVAGCRASHTSPSGVDHNAQLGDAVGSVRRIEHPNRTQLPVMLQYERSFYLEPGSLTQIKPITVGEMDAVYGNPNKPGSGGVHYPNYGMALYNRYNTDGINVGDMLMARPEENKAEEDQFEGWEAFVARYLKLPLRY